MLNKRLIFLISVFLFFTNGVFGGESPIVDCQLSRITVPVAEANGKTTCAASFMYGEYVKNPTSQDDLLSSKDIIEKFEQLPEENRWQYPEYVVIKCFQEWKAGNKEGILSCFEPGYSRDGEAKLIQKTTQLEQVKAQMESFIEVVFLDKSCFGPYTRIYCVLSEGKNRKGLGGVRYVKRVGNRYMLTREINMTHIFDKIVGRYGAKKVMFREDIPLNPDTSNMKEFAIDVNDASAPENKDVISVFSTNRSLEIPASFSENYLGVYLDCEPINIQLKAGEQLEGLSNEMRFLETAVTKHRSGTETEILATWSTSSKDKIQRRIGRLKNAGVWPESRLSCFGPTQTILASIYTSTGKVIYYQKQAPSARQANAKVYSIGLRFEDGSYSLFNPSSQGQLNCFTTEVFCNAVKILCEQ